MNQEILTKVTEDRTMLTIVKEFGELYQRAGAPSRPALRLAARAGVVLLGIVLGIAEGIGLLRRHVLLWLVSRGWSVSPARYDDFQLSSLLASNGETAQVPDSHMVGLLDDGYCSDIVSSWFNHEGFRTWRSKIEDALVAHKAGRYALAVPMWLIALEGVARTEFGRTAPWSLYSRKPSSGVASLRADLRPIGAMSQMAADGFIEAVTLISRGGRESQLDLAVRRHGIFHGEDPSFGTRKESLQCLLLLDTLHYLTPVK